MKLASSVKLAEGKGEAHVYVIYFEPGGEIGAHEAALGQLFFAVAGNGLVAGADGVHVPLAEVRWRSSVEASSIRREVIPG